ncbi:MAG TPA: CotH kinase family protein, partial [Planctomycetota bacterium]|nr:CotH kinase family protein [Planctomycetota bacterium]
LLDRWFPDDDGLLYEMDDRHVVNDSGRRVTSYDARLLAPPWPLHAERLALGASDPELYRWHFEPRGRSEHADLGSIIDLARLFDPARTPDPDFDERAPESIDVESFLRVLAVRRNTDDWDTWGGRRGKNAYLYRSEHDGRFHLIPWDMELTFGSPLAFLPPSLESEPAGAFAEVRRLLERPSFRRRYLQLLAELARGPLSSAFLEPLLGRLDARGMLGTEAGRPGGFIDERRRLLEELLHDARHPELALAIDGTTTDASTSKTVIRGRAALDIVTVLVSAPVEPGDLEDAFATLGAGHPLEWEARFALAPGSHPIEAIGFDATGGLVARIEARITVEPRGELFVRGDADGSGRIDVSDAVTIIRAALGLIGGDQLDCDDALDANDDGRIDIADSLFLLRALFASGSPPPPPFPDRGHDPTPDALECDGSSRLDP